VSEAAANTVIAPLTPGAAEAAGALFEEEFPQAAATTVRRLKERRPTRDGRFIRPA
jgi:hypothetical protein